MGTRRRFTPEYRRDVASLVLDTGSSIASVARDLGLGESVVGRWVKIERERRQAAESEVAVAGNSKFRFVGADAFSPDELRLSLIHI